MAGQKQRKVLEEMYYAVYYWSEDDPDYRGFEGLYCSRYQAEVMERIECERFDVLADIQEYEALDYREAYRAATSVADFVFVDPEVLP